MRIGPRCRVVKIRGGFTQLYSLYSLFSVDVDIYLMCIVPIRGFNGFVLYIYYTYIAKSL
jgi:hypothetical protein